jgi:hypothetical protein
LGRWIFSKIGYPMVNSWKEGFINIFWADRHETPEGNRRNGKFQIWYAKPWVPLRCTRKPSKGKHWMCDMVVGREGSNIVCFSFLNMVSRVDIACIEPCSMTFLYPY